MTPPTGSAPPAAPATPGGGLSLRRLNVLRFGYLVMGGGLAVVKWPSFVANAGSWTLWEGVRRRRAGPGSRRAPPARRR